MTPIDATPTSVLFDLAKRHCGVSHKELAGLLLSGRPLSDGRSPQSRLGDRTWVSRFIVHAPAGTLSDSYFCDYAVGALRFAARMKSRSKRAHGRGHSRYRLRRGRPSHGRRPEGMRPESHAVPQHDGTHRLRGIADGRRAR